MLRGLAVPSFVLSLDRPCAWGGQEFYESARERVFTAERALMYALGFDFNVGHPFEPLIGMFKDPASPVAQLRWAAPFQRCCGGLEVVLSHLLGGVVAPL